MELAPHQNQIAEDTHRFRVVCIGRRGGKTTLAIEEIKGKVVAKPRRVCYIAPTYQQARDIAWEMLKKELLPIITNINDSRLEIKTTTQKGGESLIILRGWESIETLRGQAFDFIVIDEVAMMRNFWENWQEVIRPTLTDTKGEVMFISTPKGYNHFYDLYDLEKTDNDFKSFHFTTYDNPFIPKEEIDKAQLELTIDRFAQEYMADFRKTQGLVYPEFNRQEHLFNSVVQTRKERILGIDFGYTNPTAVLTIDIDYVGTYWVTEEWYRTGKTNIEIIEYAKSKQANALYPDPAEPDRIEEMKRHGLNTREVNKDTESGINKVRELFKAGKIRIHTSCSNLINEIETYSYPDKQSMKNPNETPIKENDHACFVAGTIVNGQRIEDVGVQTGIEDAYTYEVAGEAITSTANHLIMTHRGLVKIDALRYNDVVWKNKSLFMTVSGSSGIREVLSGLKGITISVVRRLLEAKERDYIDIYGLKQKEKSLKDSMFIILTAIPAIIHWITLSFLTALNTLRVTLQKKSKRGLKRISRELLNSLQNGLRPQPANVGVERWATKMPTSCLREIYLNESAIYAKENILQKVTDGTGFVTTTAVKKLCVGHVPIYNLRTKSGMYIANGVLVSNCDALRYALTTNSVAMPFIARQYIPGQK